MSNRIKDLLCMFKICDEGSIEIFYPRVRDRDDVHVLRCKKSGVIFLSSSDHIGIEYYKKQDIVASWESSDRNVALKIIERDDHRRAEQFQSIIAGKGKKWLDVGSGLGGVLDLLSSKVGQVFVIEPQDSVRALLLEEGYTTYTSIDDVQENNFDVVTLFHVFEHLNEPIESLRTIRKHMKPGGKIIVETPHANDFLIKTLNNEAFKSYTFWSEHLILHTRKSLEVFMQESGFKNIAIEGHQRFPLANHLYWLAHGEPKGHVIWKQLSTLDIDKAYSDILKKIDQTDTLIAVAEA